MFTFWRKVYCTQKEGSKTPQGIYILDLHEIVNGLKHVRLSVYLSACHFVLTFFSDIVVAQCHLEVLHHPSICPSTCLPVGEKLVVNIPVLARGQLSTSNLTEPSCTQANTEIEPNRSKDTTRVQCNLRSPLSSNIKKKIDFLIASYKAITIKSCIYGPWVVLQHL